MMIIYESEEKSVKKIISAVIAAAALFCASGIFAGAAEYSIYSDYSKVTYPSFADIEEFVHDKTEDDEISPEVNTYLSELQGIYIPKVCRKQDITKINVFPNRVEIHINYKNYDCVFVNYLSEESWEKKSTSPFDNETKVISYNKKTLYIYEGEYYDYIPEYESYESTNTVSWKEKIGSETMYFNMKADYFYDGDLLKFTDLKFLKFNYGLVKRGDDIYCIDGNKTYNGWHKIGKYFYYFRDNIAVTGSVKINGVNFIFDENGHYTGIEADGEIKEADGFERRDDGLYYFNGDKTYNGWYRIGGYLYYFTDNKAMTKRTEINGIWYVFDENGHYTGLYTGELYNFWTDLAEGYVDNWEAGEDYPDYAMAAVDGEYLYNDSYCFNGYWWSYDDNGRTYAMDNFPREYDENGEPYTGPRK